ncbi:dynactin subunit 2-like [Sitodiplosis mosellana]|uniref:dynactin subunit 2-like n=1 Tax=Sitodiplosis mosellana TaxID=263140 RepID=UPI0024448824|nr:dynactin subunit 2-like [Sitodiplosis mosellana]
MVDPKFEDLPGIAHDEPDVYETPDVPEVESPDFYEEPETEHIERLHISPKDAYNKFKGKYLTGYVDFSDRISRRLRTGYDARSGIYEYGTDDEEKETPVQKCRRLQLEMDELMQELDGLNTDKTTSKEDKQCYEAIGNVVNNAKKVLTGLRLEQVLGSEATTATADAEMKKLLTQIDEYKKSSSSVQVPVKSATELVASSRIAELENKLHGIESVIGAQPEKLTRLSLALHSNNLLDAVQKVSTIAALLQPTQLDVIETRIENLANKMDAIVATSNSISKDASVDQKTIELYEIAKRAEPIAQLLPNMLQRMQALENLHNYATNFSKIIAELEAQQQTLLTSLAGNKKLLQNVQEAFAVNLENVKKEVAKLESRLNTLKSK